MEMSPEQQAAAYRLQDEKKKSKPLAYLLWVFGLHRFYISNAVVWCLFIISLFLYVWFIRWIIDLFLINITIDNYNNDVLTDAVQKIYDYNKKKKWQTTKK